MDSAKNQRIPALGVAPATTNPNWMERILKAKEAREAGRKLRANREQETAQPDFARHELM